MYRRLIAGVVLSAAFAASQSALAAPTPEPGGANQTHGVVGTLQQTLFNGQVRVRRMTLGKPDGSANENYTDSADTKWIAFHALMSNGTAQVLTLSQFSASLVDADGIAIAAQPDKVRPMGTVVGIPPGGAWKEAVFFNVPPDFKPVKLVLVPSDTHRYKTFRITIAPDDLHGR